MMWFFNISYNETSKWTTSPVPGFLYSGSLDFSDGSWGFVGTAGRFGSSTTNNKELAYGFYIATPNILQPDNITLRHSGRTVRCVAK